MSEQQPLVSVMIPYYNCKEYIAETLASVEAQTYGNIETLIVNDGSDPEHAAALENLLAEKPHIRYATQTNQGVAAARNHAARLALGRYFLFLDADDIILPEYIAKCVSILESDAACKLVYPQAEFFDAKSGEWNMPLYCNLANLLGHNCIPAIAMHRADDFSVIGGFDESLASHEDWDLWIRLLVKGGNVYRIPHILFQYRKRADSSSMINRLEQNPLLEQKDWQRIYEKHSRLFLENGLGYFELADIKRRYEKITASFLYKFICFFKKNK